METFLLIFFKEKTISVRKLTLKTKNDNSLYVKRMDQRGDLDNETTLENLSL